MDGRAFENIRPAGDRRRTLGGYVDECERRCRRKSSVSTESKHMGNDGVCQGIETGRTADRVPACGGWVIAGHMVPVLPGVIGIRARRVFVGGSVSLMASTAKVHWGFRMRAVTVPLFRWVCN